MTKTYLVLLRMYYIWISYLEAKENVILPSTVQRVCFVVSHNNKSKGLMLPNLLFNGKRNVVVQLMIHNISSSILEFCFYEKVILLYLQQIISCFRKGVQHANADRLFWIPDNILERVSNMLMLTDYSGSLTTFKKGCPTC